MLEHSVSFCPAHLYNLCQLQLCFEQINDDDELVTACDWLARLRKPVTPYRAPSLQTHAMDQDVRLLITMGMDQGVRLPHKHTPAN